jgi:hypothetical protein
MIDRSALEQVAGRHLGTMQSPSGMSLILHLHGSERPRASPQAAQP